MEEKIKIETEKQLSQDSHSEDDSKESKSGDKLFIYAVFFIIGIVLALIFVPGLFEDKSKLTLDDLHILNKEGKLSKDEGYMYNGYSFVKFHDLWYTELKTPSGKRIFSLPFHYSPNEVEYIHPVGQLNYSKFGQYDGIYSTIDPTDENGGYLGVAKLETAQVLVNAFGKSIIDACVKNETRACIARPIVDCKSTTEPVLYFASENNTNLIYLDNCAIISGDKEGLFKATDRMLYDLLEII